MGLSPRALIGAAIALLSLAACSVNTAPPAATIAAPAPPAPVVVQPAPPSSGTVVVQPRTY